MHVLNQTRCIYMYMYMYMSPYKHTDTYTCTCICTYTLYVYIFTHCYIAMLKFHFSTVIRVFLPHLTSLPHAVCVCPITCILMCVMCISTCNSKTDIHLYVYMYMYMYMYTCTLYMYARVAWDRQIRCPDSILQTSPEMLMHVHVHVHSTCSELSEIV